VLAMIQKDQLTSLDFLSPKPKKSDYDFDLFIVGQFRRATAGVQHVGRSIQADTALAPNISQQAFEHAMDIRVAGVIPARVTPVGKTPIGAASFGD
jgi:hypothetical protein